MTTVRVFLHSGATFDLVADRIDATFKPTGELTKLSWDNLRGSNAPIYLDLGQVAAVVQLRRLTR